MRVINNDIFKFIGYADAICITTNGDLRTNGNGICGAGIALAAKNRWPRFEYLLGLHLRERRNVPSRILKCDLTEIWSFPTKDHWKNKSTLELIDNSAKVLREVCDNNQWNQVMLPKPGCSSGGLNWDSVKKILHKYFDDRFIICDIN